MSMCANIYAIKVLSGEGSEEKTFYVATSEKIDSRMLQLCGLCLDGGFSPETIRKEVPTAQSYVSVDSHYTEGWVDDALGGLI